MAAQATTVKAPIKMVDVSDLRLDASNLRIARGNGGQAQKDLLMQLYRRYDVDDLLASLAENGYFREEPLIAIPEEGHTVDEPPYIVLEGNRRLAALKMLLFKEDQDVVQAKQLPTVAPHAQPLLSPVPVKVYGTRAEVSPYLRVRHTAGVKPWDVLEKAKYVRNLIEEGLTLSEVARRIGSGGRTDVVRRWLLTLYVLEQANKVADEPWDELEEGFDFSWLSTSLGYPGVRQYLGISHEVFVDPREEPVPEKSVPNLLLHLTDLYGSPDRSRQAAVRDSLKIAMLADVYATNDALSALRGGAPLDVAYRKTVNEKTHLIHLLGEASYQLTEANGIALNHRGHKEAQRHARHCFEICETLLASLEK